MLLKCVLHEDVR